MLKFLVASGTRGAEGGAQSGKARAEPSNWSPMNATADVEIVKFCRRVTCLDAGVDLLGPFNEENRDRSCGPPICKQAMYDARSTRSKRTDEASRPPCLRAACTQ
ncbi:unnamed protein product, partial [Scytosiphon promiscuus]